MLGREQHPCRLFRRWQLAPVGADQPPPRGSRYLLT